MPVVLGWVVMGAAAALGGILMRLGVKKVTGIDDKVETLAKRVDVLDPNVPTPPNNNA